jgi:hypothetical protein
MPKIYNWVAGEYLTDSRIQYISYSGDLEIISQEFFLYDANAIISAVGGGLGMFLGVSCLGVITNIFRILTNRNLI